jgi:hypothetical protein
MRKSNNKCKSSVIRLAAFFLVAIAMVGVMATWSSVNVSANHPVLVEGNCDSPVPGTTLVSPGTCGDFDGDGRIGTAEDTDGADRIFGTLAAALGPGTGAAAGTGANNNGTITIVSSGRFAETLYIGQNLQGPGFGGVANPGDVTIAGAPGVEAIIDAVLQGDPAGGNNTRQGANGIAVIYFDSPAHVVTLRNLVLRNFANGISVGLFSRLNIDNCRFQNNLNNGVDAFDFAKVTITRSHFDGNGFRTPGAAANPGDGLVVRNGAQVKIADSVFAHNTGAGIRNQTGAASNVTLYKVATYFNTPDISGAVTISPDPNSSN